MRITARALQALRGSAFKPMSVRWAHALKALNWGVKRFPHPAQ